MKTVGQLMDTINEIAPFDSALDFDNVGLQVGGKEAPVDCALIALDITPRVVEEACEKGAQLIIAHHPPIFHPLKHIAPDSVLCTLIQKGLAAIACHTNLDLARHFGVNQALAQVLGLHGLRPDDQLPLFYGRLPQPMTLKNLAAWVGRRLDSRRVLYTPGHRTVETVAICGGAGGEFIYEIGDKADLLLTGEARHDEWIFAAHNRPMLTAGHYETEKPFGALLCQYLQGRHSEVRFLLSEKEENPVAACI